MIWNFLNLFLRRLPSLEVLQLLKLKSRIVGIEPTFLHQSLWILAMLIVISLKSATF
jgi:hypothetical protein